MVKYPPEAISGDFILHSHGFAPITSSDEVRQGKGCRFPKTLRCRGFLSCRKQGSPTQKRVTITGHFVNAERLPEGDTRTNILRKEHLCNNKYWTIFNFGFSSPEFIQRLLINYDLRIWNIARQPKSVSCLNPKSTVVGLGNPSRLF